METPAKSDEPPISGLEALPLEVRDAIGAHLPPLSRVPLAQVHGARRQPLLSGYQSNPARIWRLIFKNDEWIEAVLRDENTMPCLVGSDLRKIYEGGDTDGTKLALLTNDWTWGNAFRYKKLLLSSLQKHEYDEQSSVVFLLRSGIQLSIQDCISRNQWISMKAPSDLFKGERKSLSTNALYYTESTLDSISSLRIGKVFPPTRYGVYHLCSIELKQAGGSTEHRIFINPERPCDFYGESPLWMRPDLRFDESAEPAVFREVDYSQSGGYVAPR